MKTMTPLQAKTILRKKGYSQRRGATAMGYSFSHVAKALADCRPVSRPMAQRLRALAPSSVAYRVSGFANLSPRKHPTSNKKSK